MAINKQPPQPPKKRIKPKLKGRIDHEVNGPGTIINCREPDGFSDDWTCTVLHDSGLEQDYTFMSDHPHMRLKKNAIIAE